MSTLLRLRRAVLTACALMLLTAGGLLAFGAASATDSGDLYQAQTTVTGQREQTRIPGFADCLKDVLVKVSGDPRLLGDPRIDAMAARAASFVSAFRYHDKMEGIPHHDEQGTYDRPYDLIVDFDRAKIDGALRALGRKPWVSPRPRLVIFLIMERANGGYVLANEGDHALEREALMAAALKRGLSIILPTEAALGSVGFRPDTEPAAALPRLEAAARRLGGDRALVGRMAWSDKALSWIAEWRLSSERGAKRWRVHSETFDDGFRQAFAGALQVLSGHGAPRQPARP